MAIVNALPLGPCECFTWRQDGREDASTADATEHAIARWQALFWCRSKDCQHVIQVQLFLRAKANHQIQGILAKWMPPFFTPGRADAFLALLHDGIITDVNLRGAIVDFLARWPSQLYASYPDLLADSVVSREASILLPKDLPMWWWISKRLHEEMSLRCGDGSVSDVVNEEYDVGSILPSLRIHLCRGEHGLLRQQAVIRYLELAGQHSGP